MKSLNRNHPDRHWIHITLAIIPYVALGASVSADDVAAPFHSAPQLFQFEKESLGLSTIPGEHVLLYLATEDGNKFCHHPNLAVFGDELYCMWSNGILDEDAPGQRILYCRTADGSTWTEPSLLAEHTDGGGYCVAAGFLVEPDKLVAFYTGTGSHNFHDDSALLAIASTDGRTWSDPQTVTGGFYIAAPRRIGGNRLLLAGEHVGRHRKNGRMRLLTTQQDDGLGGWQEALIPVKRLGIFGYTEPSPFLRPDGTLIISFRNYTGWLYASTSSDHGRSWTAPSETTFPDSTARFSTGNLSDGTVYLINNPMRERFDRSLLAIALSRDGVTFDRAWLVRGEPTSQRFQGRQKVDGWQYPHAVAWGDHLYVAYSVNKEDVGVTRIALTDLHTD